MGHGGDLAISTKESADRTSLVSGEVTWSTGTMEIYVQPNPLNRRLTFHQTMDAFDDVRHSTKMTSEFFIEAVAYQQAAIEEMERRAFSVRAMHPIKDKRARLRVAAGRQKDLACIGPKPFSHVELLSPRLLTLRARILHRVEEVSEHLIGDPQVVITRRMRPLSHLGSVE
jgi:hypothetical protein